MVLNTKTVGVALACASLVAAAKLSAQTTPPFALASVSVDLPNSTRTFPPGPGQEAMDGNCLTCHSAGMVLNQPALSRAAWEAEVTKMRAVYKAPIAAEDVPAIVGYLTAVKGAK